MKKVKKQIDLKLTQTDKEQAVYDENNIKVRNERYTYTFQSSIYIGHSPYFDCFIEEDKAETLKEFRTLNGLSKKDLVKWLNENYK